MCTVHLLIRCFPPKIIRFLYNFLTGIFITGLLIKNSKTNYLTVRGGARKS